MIDTATADWLLATDPALRWQVERDLLDLPEPVWAATRARVATEGIGARILAAQDPDGRWAGGAYFPADFDPEGPEGAPGAGQPWTATTWSLTALREWGVDAALLGDTAARLAAVCRWEYDDLPYWEGEVDACINAMTLANGAWLGADLRTVAAWFPAHRLADGGWNCEWVNGSLRSSFHSTLNVVIGLLDHEERTGGSDALRAARHAGEAYLLERRLLYRAGDGAVVGPWVTQLTEPGRWRYSVLRAAEHLRAAALRDGTPPDPRVADAIGAIRAQRGPDGRWRQGRPLAGRAWVTVDVPEGDPSPWLTFRALRVLRWWESR